MPKKRCADCEGQYGNYVRKKPEREDWLPCANCASRRRERQTRESERESTAAEDHRLEDLAEQAHRRQRELRKDEIENEIAKKKIEADLQKSKHAVEEAFIKKEIAQEETKQLEAKVKIAQEETKHAQLEALAKHKEAISPREHLVAQEKTKQVKIENDRKLREYECDNEIAKKRIEAEVQRSQADIKREIAQEETKQLEAKAKLEEAVSSRECLLAQEKTKQVKIENEEHTKQMIEEQRTKQMMAMNEKLSHCVKLTEQLRLAGSNKQAIEGVLKNVLGNSENKPKKLSSAFTPSEKQSRFLDSINNRKLSPRMMEKPSCPTSQSLHSFT